MSRVQRILATLFRFIASRPLEFRLSGRERGVQLVLNVLDAIKFMQNRVVPGFVFLAVPLLIAPAKSEGGLRAETFTGQLQRNGPVELHGWVRVRGEFMIYPSLKAMRKKLKYPNCISGVMDQQAKRDLRQYDEREVWITGEFIDYSSLADEDSFLPRKELAGSIIPNFCFGTKVMRISSIRRAA